MNNLIAVTIGDINGLGIDLVLKLFNKKKISNFVLFTNIDLLKIYFKEKKINIKLNLVNTVNQRIKFKNKYLNIYSYKCNSPEDNTYKSIIYGNNECIKNRFIGLITLPLRKDLIKININKNFKGHTEFLQILNKKKYSNMIMYHKDIIISPLTTHIKLNSITKEIKRKNFIFNQIVNLNKTLINDFNLKSPKILISGLNPHAGENGTIGKEEILYIRPVLKKLFKKGILVDGPISGDAMLIDKNISKYNCFLFIFHDQAMIPFKYISKFSGINYTGNLKIIRTSPDHGTAYDLVGKNNISYKSLLKCFEMTRKIYNNRKNNVKNSKKISRSKFS